MTFKLDVNFQEGPSPNAVIYAKETYPGHPFASYPARILETIGQLMYS